MPRGGLARAAWRFGPAFLVSVGYMDPGNWATDIEGGARFGFSLLWVLLLSNAIALFLQALASKLGIVTGKSLAQNCRDRLPGWLNLLLWVAAEAAVLATDLAEFLGAALGFSLLLGVPLFEAAILTGVVVLALLGLERYGYRVVELAIISLVAVVGVAYIVELAMIRPALGPILRGLVEPDLSGGRLFLAIGILGATVMPHNLYLHSALVQARRPLLGERAHIASQHLDAAVALNAALLVNAAIMVTAAATFHGRGPAVTSLAQAHAALVPLLGGLAAGAFAVALLASGLSSSTTAVMASQVVLQGFLGVRVSLFVQRLLTMVPALVVIWIGVDSLKILILSQVFLSFGLPFAVVPLVWLSQHRGVMGEFASRRATTVIASAVAALIALLNGLLICRLLAGAP